MESLKEQRVALPLWCSRTVSFSCYLILLINILCLLSGTLHLNLFMRLFPNWAPIPIDSATCFILNTLALLLLKSEKNSFSQQMIAILCLLAALLLAAIHISSDLKINQDIAGMFEPNTLSAMPFYVALNHLLITLSVLLINTRNLKNAPVQLFVLWVFFTSLICALYSLYNLSIPLHSLQIPFNTALLFMLFSIAIILARPKKLLWETLLQKDLAGKSVRRILPFIFFLPILLGLIIYALISKLSAATEQCAPLIIASIIMVFGLMALIRGKLLDTHMKRYTKTKLNLKHAKEIAEEASHFKTNFLTKISHDLRTPLNGIIGFAEMIYHGKVGPVAPDHKEYIGDILTSARQLQLLINDVLDLAKVESGKMEFHPERVNMNSIFDELPMIFKTLIDSKNITFKTHVDPALGEVIIDPVKLKQIIYNYVSNALKCTPDGGVVTVRASLEPNNYFRIVVEDNGIGIHKSDLNRLFTEFQQLDKNVAKKYPSTGLGLAIVRRIVEAQGGNVGVESIFGQGSLFSAVLPRLPISMLNTNNQSDKGS